MLARILAIACLLALLGAASAQATTSTFGADLTLAADNTGTCSMLGQSSCTFFSGLAGPSFYAPASGTVTAVRVKTGNFTQGPMQILVMRSLYQNKLGDPGHPYFACCFVEAYGPTFTPDPNAVTTVATSLAMVEDPTPAADDFVTSARGDFLALSVLAPDVPVPAHFDNASIFSGFAPAPTPATVAAPSPNPLFAVSNGVGYQILMSADLDTGAGGGGTTTTPPPAAGTPPPTTNTPQATPLTTAPLKIASAGQLLGTTTGVSLTCVLTTACNGVLTLTAGSKVYGKQRFQIPTGRTKSVKVVLNAAGRRRLAKHRTLTVVATTKVAGQTVSSTVTLKRKRR